MQVLALTLTKGREKHDLLLVRRADCSRTMAKVWRADNALALDERNLP